MQVFLVVQVWSDQQAFGCGEPQYPRVLHTFRIPVQAVVGVFRFAHSKPRLVDHSGLLLAFVVRGCLRNRRSAVVFPLVGVGQPDTYGFFRLVR